MPFTSPTRSGVDYISAGLDWAIFNQQRDRDEADVGHRRRGPPGRRHAAPRLQREPAGGTSSAPTRRTTPNPAKNRAAGHQPRPSTTIIARTVWSRRFGYVEPYTGFWLQARVPAGRAATSARTTPPNDLERMPPLLGSFTLGMEVVPYEHREQYQRLSADFRFKGTYHSPGRDYSELFDALGLVDRRRRCASRTRRRTWAGPGGRASPRQAPRSVYFTGITEQQAYGSFTLSASATWQAGQYIKFTAGSAFTYAQPHLVTAADTCTPEQHGPHRGGRPCTSAERACSASPNPDHHDLIDLPGHRFSVDDTTIVDLWVMGVVMF